MAPRLSGPARACATVFALAVAPLRVLAEGEPRADPAAVATSAPADAAASRDADLPTLDEIVVVGLRPRGQVARDPTASATVIEADRFAGEAKGVAELVATAPGVAVNDYGGLGQIATVSIRGASSEGVLVLLDGLPLNPAAGGAVDLASIPRHWIERIEVVRGVEGAAYGSGAMGGVVNVVTRAGSGPASAEATAGSFGTWSGAADASAGDAKAWLRAAASAESSTGRFPYLFDPQPAIPESPLVPLVRENNATGRAGLLVRAGLASPARRWDALVSLSGGRRELPGFPYHLTPDDWERDGRLLASLRLAAPVAAGLTLAARATARGDLLDVERTGLLTVQRGGAASGEVEAIHDHGVGVLSVRGSAGGEQLRSTGLAGTQGRAVLSAAASEDLRLGAVRVGPAVRLDRIGPFGGWSAKVGAGAPLGGPLAVRASFGRTFRAPSITELYVEQGLAAPNPDLRPEEALGGDVAVVAEGRLGFASLGANGSLYEDLVYWQPVGLGRLRPFNAGRTSAAGVEAEGATAPLGPGGFALEGSYTYLHTEILRGSAAVVGNDVPRRPRHRLFGRASAAPPDGAGGAHLELHYVGVQYEDDFNARKIPAATVWNAGVWLRLLRRPNVRAQLEVKNLLDDRTLLDPLGNPLPGRMVFVTLRVESPPTKGSTPP